MYQIIAILMAIWPLVTGQTNSGLTIVENTAILPLNPVGAACENHVGSSSQTIGKLQAMPQTSFIVFDNGFFSVLGTSPTLERIASLSQAPIDSHYVLTHSQGSDNLLIIAQDGTVLPLNFGKNPVANFTLHLPIMSLSAASQGNMTYITTNGPDVPMVAALDMNDLTVTPVLNNYQGHHFSNLKSIVATRSGDLIFSDVPRTPANYFPGDIFGIALSPDERSIYSMVASISPTAMQSALDSAWRDAFKRRLSPEIKASETIFDLGGDLITASLISAHMERQGHILSIEDVLEYPTWFSQLTLLTKRSRGDVDV
ncbi:hypothetical protein UA08_03948 [Talaromyces atroroseus]|uniref:Carrier domain-containing protein n=1 Tax=Talaromyces atroroseus TaxID=1441469 RepID=A0A1Q5Q8K8_TALAT|nr:hypothetical protein UA08_03948 [Talaromyces atroroseus]OKL60466.1 hypothetical protein UA08_03948 [Talaromyces atroroseus]